VAADDLGAISSICAALGLEPSEQQLQQLAHYLDMLQRWNATYNLTAVRDRDAMLTQHLADCLAVVQPLVARCSAGRVLDVGSGGGLPGVVLAVLAPGLDVTCVDTVGKKAAFIRQVAGQLSLTRLHAAHARVETLAASGFDLVTSRAFASLVDFTSLTARLLAPGGVWMAMKGKHPAEEIAALPPGVAVFHVEQLQVPGLAADRCLVWMRPAA
jgi:16S rRNA (guanine527-N7)-methyltransferase